MKARGWAVAFVAAMSAAVAFANPVFAQPKSNDVTMTEAKQRFQEGINFADAGNHEAARLKFNQAWSLLKSPAILYNLARSEQLSGHPVEALEHYRLFAKMASDPKVTEQQKQRASENIAQLSEKVGQIAIDAPATAQLSIDGKPIEWTPNADPTPVLPGKHDVTATIDGTPTTVSVECTAGTVTRAKLNAPPPPPAPAATPPAPKNSEPPPPTGPGFWTAGRAVGAGLAGAGIAGLAVGVVFQLKANSTVDDIEKARSGFGASKDSACAVRTDANAATCDSLKGKADDVKSAETLRSVFMISGGALLAGGVVLFLISPPSKSNAPTQGVRVLPYASSGDAGIMALGRF